MVMQIEARLDKAFQVKFNMFGGEAVMNKKLALLPSLAICICKFVCGSALAEESIVTIDSRPGVTVGFIATHAATPAKAVAILFPGGGGKLKLWKGTEPQSKNFLVRSRNPFSERGVLAITLDVPSDRRRNGLNNFRGTDEHRKDVAAVLKWVRKRTAAPLWLIGTSRGTVSLSYIAGKLPIDGVVFSASVTEESRRRPSTALDGELESIGVPVLLVHHWEDNCRVTPALRLSSIADRLTNSPKVEKLLFKGGKQPESNACRSLSPHGFYGIEAKVVGSIVDWMIANGPS